MVSLFTHELFVDVEGKTKAGNSNDFNSNLAFSASLEFSNLTFSSWKFCTTINFFGVRAYKNTIGKGLLVHCQYSLQKDETIPVI